MTAIVPSKDLNPPVWLPVTLEPMNDKLEPAVIAYVLALATAFTPSTASATIAESVLSAGFEQPATKSATNETKNKESDLHGIMGRTNIRHVP